jgi:hypothetical protein
MGLLRRSLVCEQGLKRWPVAFSVLMTLQMKLLLAVGWIGSVLGVALWAQGGGDSPRMVIVQSLRQTPGQHIGPIITGDQIGFQRVIGPADPDGRVLGKLMVLLNNEWVEVRLAGEQ